VLVLVGALGVLGALAAAAHQRAMAHALEAMQIEMHPYVAALGEEGRRQLRAGMEARSKLNTDENRVYLEHEVKLGEAADARLHRLPLDTSKVDTSLWNDRPAPCRGSRIRSSSYTSISGDTVQFPLERIECPYSKSGCCHTDESSTPAERNGGSDRFLGDNETPRERQEDTEDTAMWKMRELAAKQQADGNGPMSQMSPLLSPLALHTEQDAQTQAEEGKLDDETRMEDELAAEMQRVRVIKRLLLQRRKARAAQGHWAKEDSKPDSLWKGVDIELTPQDLEEPTMPEQMRQDARWQARNLTNMEWNDELTDTDEEIKAAQKVLRADARLGSFDTHTLGSDEHAPTHEHSAHWFAWSEGRGRGSGGGGGGYGDSIHSQRAGGRGGGGVRGLGRQGLEDAADRAEQAEIAEVTPPSSSLWWEWEPRLHYHDLR
jgi:hypothetical protein